MNFNVVVVEFLLIFSDFMWKIWGDMVYLQWLRVFLVLREIIKGGRIFFLMKILMFFFGFSVIKGRQFMVLDFFVLGDVVR